MQIFFPENFRTFTCKCFGRNAEKLAGFTTKELVHYQDVKNTDVLKAMFNKIDYTTVWILNIKIEEKEYNGDINIEARVLSCEKEKT
jgi:hypothetical protein